jgi:hypothetical protein
VEVGRDQMLLEFICEVCDTLADCAHDQDAWT